MKIARELGIHLHFLDNMNDLLGIEIDRDFIYEIGVLYLNIAAQAMIASLKNRFQEEQADR